MSFSRWRGRFALLTAAATLALVAVGGLVTSKGVGMAVPDWPNSYGYNMFAFPVSHWVGGILYEHTHRLAASGVGLMTCVLALWLAWSEPRRWLRWLGATAVAAVVLQGVLGGLRVVLLKDQLGIVHATLAQVFFALTGAIALFSSRWWRDQSATLVASDAGRSLRRWTLTVASLILLQLVLGATMRHQHAGLAIPDFPLAHGRLWPATDVESIARYNRTRPELQALNPITAAQVELQMTHRLLAAAIAIVVWNAWRRARRSLPVGHPLSRLLAALVAAVLIQACLGAATIWTGKSADVATAHVAVGALLFAGSVFAAIGAHALLRATEPEPAAAAAALEADLAAGDLPRA